MEPTLPQTQAPSFEGCRGRMRKPAHPLDAFSGPGCGGGIPRHHAQVPLDMAQNFPQQLKRQSGIGKTPFPEEPIPGAPIPVHPTQGPQDLGDPMPGQGQHLAHQQHHHAVEHPLLAKGGPKPRQQPLQRLYQPFVLGYTLHESPSWKRVWLVLLYQRDSLFASKGQTSGPLFKEANFREGTSPLLKHQQPTAPRWDYLIGYGDARCLFCLEVHDASDVTGVLAKKRWLDNWLKGQGQPLRAWARGGVRYVLVPTGHAPGKRSRDMRRYAQAGIQVTRKLRLRCAELDFP